MSENLYEGMFLVDSGRFASDPEGTANAVLNILEKAGATVVANRPWQDGKLAYSVEGHRKGLHYLTYFRMAGDGVGQVNRACQLSEVVLRQLIIKHPPELFDAMVAALSGHVEEAEREEGEGADTERTRRRAEQNRGEAEDDEQDEGEDE